MHQKTQHLGVELHETIAVANNRAEYHDALELGGTQILETVHYFIKYHGINNYHGILINAFVYPVKYSNFS